MFSFKEDLYSIAICNNLFEKFFFTFRIVDRQSKLKFYLTSNNKLGKCFFKITVLVPIEHVSLIKLSTKNSLYFSKTKLKS